MIAWDYFKEVCYKFLGLHQAESYDEVVGNLLLYYKILWCEMSLKVHFVASHLNFFYGNL